MSSVHHLDTCTSHRNNAMPGDTLDLNVDSASSDSESTDDEEERLKQLFSTCDRDGDGFIDRQDLIHMCQLLNMEDVVDDIIELLGMSTSDSDECVEMSSNSRISFDDFMRCRSQLADDQRPRLEALQLTQSNRTPLELVTLRVDSHIGVSSSTSVGCEDVEHHLHISLETCPSLHTLLESKEPQLFRSYMDSVSCHKVVDILHVANELHVAALSSLRSEILEISAHLQRILNEKEQSEKQLAKVQMDRMRMQREVEEKMEQQAIRYEDRITELHSVIAELRKKIDLRQINIIHEEDECEESDGVASILSVEDGSVNCSRSASVADLGNELSIVVSNYQFALCGSSEDNVDQSCGEADEKNVNEKNPCSVSMSPRHELSEVGSAPLPPRQESSQDMLEFEIISLKSENAKIKETVARQQVELNRIDSELETVRIERDLLRNKVVELQKKSQEVLSLTQSVLSPQSQSVKSASGPSSPNSPAHSRYVSAPVSKVAELKKLRTGRQDKPVLGAEISCLGVVNTKVAEHLAQDIQECSRVQEILQQRSAVGRDVSDDVIHEFEIELERLTSKADHLKAQNDVLNLTLSESKSHCDHLTTLIGKYESNLIALQLSLHGFDHLIQLFHVLLGLVDTKLALVFSQAESDKRGSNELPVRNSEVGADSEVHLAHMSAQSAAKQLLLQLDRASYSECDREQQFELSNGDEGKLRQYLRKLLEERSTILQTVVPLECINVESLSHEYQSFELLDAQKLDMENAVLMQELMSMKEEKAELKLANSRLTKELTELKITQRQRSALPLSEDDRQQVQLDGGQLQNLSFDLEEALKRESRLKIRVRELTMSLEKLSKNSELRYQQSAGFVSELKKANSALVCAFEKAKKKYVVKIKKMETQLALQSERYESQMAALRQKLLAAYEELHQYCPSYNVSSL